MPRRLARRLALALALLTPLAGCTARASPPPPPVRVRVPAPVVLDLVPHMLPVVRVDLPDHPGQAFVLDTGAEDSVVLHAKALELGLPLEVLERPGTRTGANGVTLPVTERTRLERIALGAATIEHVTCIVADADLGEPDWVGILGQDVLAKLPVVVDRERGELHLLPTDWDADAIQAYLGEARLGPGAWAVVETERDPCPHLTMTVGDTDYRLAIDTGATGTSLPVPVFETLGLEPKGSYSAYSVTGEYDGRTYDVEGFDLFGLKVSGEFRDGPLDHGLLGMDVLGELVFVLDGPGGKIWLHNRAP